MSYQLIHLFVSALCSVLCVLMRNQKIEIILILRQQFNFDIVNVAFIHKRTNELKIIILVKKLYFVVKYTEEFERSV